MMMGLYKVLECDMRAALPSDTTPPQEVTHLSTQGTCLSMLAQGHIISIIAHIAMKSVESMATIHYLHRLHTPPQTLGLARLLMDI